MKSFVISKNPPSRFDERLIYLKLSDVLSVIHMVVGIITKRTESVQYF